MTGKHPPPVGGQTLADGLREDLAQCERWVIQIGPATDGLALLKRLDHITDGLERLEARGADLRAERGRLETVLAQLERRATKLVAQTGPQLAHERPENARWWWYLDEHVATRRRRRLQSVVLAGLVGVVGLLFVYWLYDQVLAPPPHVRQFNQLVREGEQAILAGDLARAIERLEAAVALNPDEISTILLLGVLHGAVGDSAQATDTFEQARTLSASEIGFLFQRGTLYLSLGDADAAQKDALAAIESAPERPEGFFLLGSIAEQTGDLSLAVAAFQTASDLADAVGEVELQATARIRLANALQLQMAQPEP